MLHNLKKFNIILASKSPRRKQLLEELGIPFKVKIKDINEVYPDDLLVENIPEFLAELKAEAFKNNISAKDLLITSDTIVCLDGKVLEKPKDYDQAFKMLLELSGKTHQVLTGVCLLSKTKKVSFTATTDVHFKELSNDEISYYICNFKPYDKAGAYGIQEWIGHIAVAWIKGSYFNVMGLPIQRLYEELSLF